MTRKTSIKPTKTWRVPALLVIGLTVLALTWKCATWVGKAAMDSHVVPQPTHWMIADKTQVYVGGDLTTIVGTDQCNNGVGDAYPCWKFSLTPGDTQVITYGNGQREILTTRKTNGRGVLLTNNKGQLIRVAELDSLFWEQ